MHVDSNTGFLDDYVSEEDEEYDDADGCAEGLATAAGFRALLAKARGEMPHKGEATDDKKGTKKDGSSRPSSARMAVPPGNEASGDTLAQVMAAAEKSAQAATKKVTTTESNKATGVVVLDERGQRILTINAVRKEICLHPVASWWYSHEASHEDISSPKEVNSRTSKP